jgi:hypothetical protein
VTEELIADLTAKRTWLRESEVVGIRGLAAADEASLLSDEPKVRLFATARFHNREDALVDPFCGIAFCNMQRGR